MLSSSITWHSLKAQVDRIKNASIKTFFDQEDNRLENFSASDNGIYFDASKALADQHILDLLLALADEAKLTEKRDAMFSGEKINNTEDRAVLHVALRDQSPKSEVKSSLDKMKDFCFDVHSGTHTGHTGEAIKHIVNIGIGGSDLGPRMVYAALKQKYKKLDVSYVSNIDGHDLDNILTEADPETTLFIVASKTFTTIETITNAQTAKDWLILNLKDKEAVSKHFVALSTNKTAVVDFGIDEKNMFPFEEWVGGRFSLWSSIGLSLCLGLGFDVFQNLLKGAFDMDVHFKEIPLNQNIPVLAGLIGVWHHSFLDFPAYACLPYDQRLEFMPLWMQQLDMESNGKSVSKNGSFVQYQTGPLVFGQPGTNGQHAFYQHIHQGRMKTVCEFIGVLKPDHDHEEHHKILLANMIAQSQALMEGSSAAEGQPYRNFEGNRPSTTILLPELSPYYLGALLALFEHKIFVQGVIWDINSFDQWGVELGKVLAMKILEDNDESDTIDPSTKELLKRCKF